MSDGIKVRSPEFDRKLAALGALSVRGLEEEGRIQAKGIIRTAILHSAPGAPGTTGAKAHARGKARIAIDIQKLMVGESDPARVERTDIESIHRAARGPGGRTRVRGHIAARDQKGRILKRGAHVKIRVPKSDLQAYIRERQQKKPGILAAGFNRAAGKLGYKPPAWVWRHNTPGAIDVSVSDRGVRITMTNKAKFAGKVSGYRKRIEDAVRDQSGKIDRQLKFVARSAAKRAGFKTR